MSDSTTIHMIPVYNQMAAATRFLSGLFRSPASNFYNSEEVEIDIDRSDEEISIVVTDLSTGYRMNSADIYTNKKFKPPVNKEAVPLNSFDLLKRIPGKDPFQDPNFRANLISRMLKQMVLIEEKIRRTIELQAAQVLQTGTITLISDDGTTLYTINFAPKATHFPTAGVAWDQATADGFGDINALTGVIRDDGLQDADQLIFGDDAWLQWLKFDDVQEQLTNRRMNIGSVNRPKMRGNGGTFHGDISIGSYNYEMWTYTGRYNHPQTGTKTRYLDAEKVVVRSSQGRLDATFGAVPNIGRLLGAQSNNLLPELPGRFRNVGGGMDLHTNVWLSNDGEQIFGGIGARPLMIPTAIDTFGCLDTGL